MTQSWLLGDDHLRIFGGFDLVSPQPDGTVSVASAGCCESRAEMPREPTWC
jgi:hypothetical protein